MADNGGYAPGTVPPPPAVVGGAPAGNRRPLPGVWTTRPEAVTCPGCNTNVTSNVDVNDCTIANWALCCCFSLCCVFIPGVCDCGSDLTHRCPNCGYALGGKSMC